MLDHIFVVNIVYYVVHIVCEVDVIANSLVLYLPFCSTLNKNFFFFSSSLLISCIRKTVQNSNDFLGLVFFLFSYYVFTTSYSIYICYVPITLLLICTPFNINFTYLNLLICKYSHCASCAKCINVHVF